MQYELINPSDPYTFLADTKEVAALTVFCIDARYDSVRKKEMAKL